LPGFIEPMGFAVLMLLCFARKEQERSLSLERS